ncbi:MAG: hypothetical protein IT277_11880, partial [Ignavibacteriaceae bacterium]|nr:hypothetical protein [Ignavibacteriaceae bacterium]
MSFNYSNILLLTGLLLLVFYSNGLTQSEQEQIQIKFNNSLALFDSARYEEALVGFNQILSDYKYNSKTTVSEFFIAKIHLELKQFNQFKY